MADMRVETVCMNGSDSMLVSYATPDPDIQAAEYIVCNMTQLAKKVSLISFGNGHSSYLKVQTAHLHLHQPKLPSLVVMCRHSKTLLLLLLLLFTQCRLDFRAHRAHNAG